jgi:hypothetical protein
MTASPLHSSKSVEHYTPSSIVEPARIALGKIDLDPASCAEANKAVRARTYFSQDGGHGGLDREWLGNVFLNPPGGKLDKNLMPIKKGPGKSAAGVWWAKLMYEWHAGRVEQAIFVCFSLNVFRAAMSADPTVRAPHEFPFVIPRKRIRYEHLDENGVRVPGAKSQHDSAIVYVPPFGQQADRFKAAFEHLGPVRL